MTAPAVSPTSGSPRASATVPDSQSLSSTAMTTLVPAPHIKAVTSMAGGSGSHRSIHRTGRSTITRGTRARAAGSTSWLASLTERTM